MNASVPLNKGGSKLIDKAQRAAARAYNAQTRALQYAGFDTGRKAAARADHWWKEFEATMDQLRTAVGQLLELHDSDAEGQPMIRWFSEEDVAKRVKALKGRT